MTDTNYPYFSPTYPCLQLQQACQYHGSPESICGNLDHINVIDDDENCYSSAMGGRMHIWPAVAALAALVLTFR